MSYSKYTLLGYQYDTLDSNNAESWTERRETYSDTSKTHLTKSLYLWDAGNATETLYDPFDKQSWTSRVTEYLLSSNLTAPSKVTTFYDNSTKDVVTYDTNNTQNYTQQRIFYDVLGKATKDSTNYDDGRVGQGTYIDGVKRAEKVSDGASAFNWSSQDIRYDTSGAISRIATVMDNSNTQLSRYENGVKILDSTTDNANTQSWETQTTRYASNGTDVVYVNTVSDDGTRTKHVYDSENKQSYKDYKVTYTQENKIFSKEITGDNGRKITLTYNSDGSLAKREDTDSGEQTNIASNGNFDLNLSNWTASGAVSIADTEQTNGNGVNLGAGSNSETGQITQTLATEAGKTYTVTFDAAKLLGAAGNDVIDLTEHLRGTATASQSTAWANNHEQYGAHKLIDGEINRNDINDVAHTLNERRPWMEIDLKDEYSITSLELHGRPQGASWNNYATVKVLDEDRKVVYQGKISGMSQGNPVQTINIPDDIEGQYIRLEHTLSYRYFMMQEVKVFGDATTATSENALTLSANGSVIKTVTTSEMPETLGSSETITAEFTATSDTTELTFNQLIPSTNGRDLNVYLDNVNVANKNEAGAYNWSSYSQTNDSAGVAVSKERVYDDGRTVTDSYSNGIRSERNEVDGGSVHSWSSIQSLFDNSGVMTSKIITYDNGRKYTDSYTDGKRVSQLREDVDNIYKWASITDSFDLSGVKTASSQTLDNGRTVDIAYTDGKRTTTTVTDSANSHSWASYVITYEDDGTTYDARTLTRDSGSVSSYDWVNDGWVLV